MKRSVKLFAFFRISVVFFAGMCIFIFSAPLLAAGAETGADREEESLFVAQRAMQDGFYDVSLSLLERFQKSYPSSTHLPEVNLLIGQCYFHQNKFLDALGKFQELLDQPSGQTVRDGALFWIGEVHFKGNNFLKASQYYSQMIKDFPGSKYELQARFALASSFMQLQKYEDALASFRELESKMSKASVSEVAFPIIECLYYLKDYKELKEKILFYMKEHPKDAAFQPYLMFYLAEAEFYLENLKEAAEWYKATIINTTDSKLVALSQLGTGWVNLRLKQYQAAEKSFSEIKADELDKDNREILLLGKAMLLSQTGKSSQAKEAYEQLMQGAKSRSLYLEASIGKADALYNLGMYNESIDTYKEAIKRVENPDQGQKAGEADQPAGIGVVASEAMDKLHHGLAWAYLKQGRFKEAIEEFQKVAQSKDKTVQVSALCQIGDAYQDSGDFQKALEAYDRILKEYPDNFYGDYVQYQIGISLLKSGQYEPAIMAFLAMKRNYPASKLQDEADYALGLAYFQNQNYQASQEIFLKFKTRPAESNHRQEALYLLGSSMYNIGRFNEAIEVFKDIIRSAGQDSEVVQKAEFEIADCYFRMGEEKEAVARFKAIRARYPDSPLTAEVMWWLGEYYYRHEDFSLAKRYFSSLIKDFSKSNLVVDAYYALGSIFSQQGEYEDAEFNFKKISELDKSDVSGQAALALGEVYQKQANYDASLSVYKQVLHDFPNLANMVYPKIAELFYLMNDYPKALENYQKCLDIAIAKDIPQIRMKIAELQHLQGKTEQAIEEYLKITYLNNEDQAITVKALLSLAGIYEEKSDISSARDIYNKLSAMDIPEAGYAKEKLSKLKGQ